MSPGARAQRCIVRLTTTPNATCSNRVVRARDDQALWIAYEDEHWDGISRPVVGPIVVLLGDRSVESGTLAARIELLRLADQAGLINPIKPGSNLHRRYGIVSEARQ